MELTGHKTRSVFDRYDIVNETDFREGVRKLGQMKKDTFSPALLVILCRTPPKNDVSNTWTGRLAGHPATLPSGGSS